jgi:HAD superfamily hydrolase (TIGR01458 family)
MAKKNRAFLIDMDGVLYQGEQAIPGAREALEWLTSNGLPYLFVTNTTSRPRSALIEKLGRFGMHAESALILTPPVAATRWLAGHADGPVALFVPPVTREEFEWLEIAEMNSSEPVAAVVVGDYGERWTFDTLNRAFRWLMEDPKPALIALGMTRYWRAQDGLRLDTAPFVVALEHATGQKAVVLGKPALPFFEAALEQLDATAAETCMIGDDIRGDIGGAQSAGIRGLLVKTGKFRPDDLAGDIHPDAVLDSFADLPVWWQSQA